MRSGPQLLALALAFGVAAATWTDICGSSGKCPGIMMGVSCKDASLCAIVGGYSNTPESVYYSRDGFSSFKLGQMDADSLMLLDIAMDAQGHGATAGLGIGNKTSALLFTSDVTEWKASADAAFIQGQDMNVLGTSGEFGFVGNTGKGEGVLFSVDGGQDYASSEWPAAWASYTNTRYGAFPSDTTWYVTGGTWPSSQKAAGLPEHGADCYTLSHKSCVRRNAEYAPLIAQHRRRLQSKSGAYTAVITKSTDAGKTWQLQFNNSGAYYFNDISCADVNTCYAVAEGFSDGSAPGARIFKTADGNQWTQVLFDQSQQASLMRVHAVSATEAWASGGYVDNSGAPFSLFYHTTDGGATWKNEGKVQYIGDVMGMHFVDSTLGWATGITEFQTSTMIKYTL